ncbi:MAG TPA: YdiU family protein [Nitrosospira sp.]|nr:YdiU family protein [Nitrosospira sp.]
MKPNNLKYSFPALKLIDFAQLQFENRFVGHLPADPVVHNIPRAVRNACYTRVHPTPVSAPRLLAWADPVGEMLGIARPELSSGQATQVLGGNRLLRGMQPYAARYGGHQFGHWAGQLGDGRAITLGEVSAPDGGRYELQLKGAGKTPYSRTADGRAVLRSSVREFLCSEAMHYLGVPTTRALSLVTTGEQVVRDMFYDGNPQPETGAIVCRVSPSFVRFGNFEILRVQNELDVLKRLADYVIGEHFPELTAPLPATGSPLGTGVYAAWFEEICRRTAILVAHWMRVGFVHGVMNTDNMSILGMTIDYGPYGWLEGFDFSWTPNTTDAQGRRYCFGNQPDIAYWNLMRLAAALAPLTEDNEALEQGLKTFGETFNKSWLGMLASKLGFSAFHHAKDDALVNDLFDLLQKVETDMTLFFRRLMRLPMNDVAGVNIDKSNGNNSISPGDRELVELFRPAFYDERQAFTPEAMSHLVGWLRRYAERLRMEKEPEASRHQRMSHANPKYVLRNYLAQQAIEALDQGDDSVMLRLMEVLRRPYDEQPGHEDLAARRPEWARDKPGCSALSCSS